MSREDEIRARLEGATHTRQDVPYLLAELESARGRLAAVELLAEELERPCADDPSIYGMATKSAGARLREALT